MAIVPNRSGSGPGSFMPGGADRAYCTHTRTVAGSPNTVGPLTPQFTGERVWDSTNFLLYQALSLSNTTWQVAPIAKLSGA